MASPRTEKRGDRFKKGGDFCTGIGCRNARNKRSCQGKSFFVFPHDQQRCRKWMQYCRRVFKNSVTPADLHRKKYKLCSDHFEASQFNVPAERKRLVWNAVPTLFNVPNPPPKISPKRPLKDRQGTQEGILAYHQKTQQGLAVEECQRVKTGGDSCSAVNCKNARYKGHCASKSFFGFPKDKARCAIWIQNSGRQDLLKLSYIWFKNYKLCSDHFESSQFTNSHRNRLNWNAVPTIFGVPNPAPKRPPPRLRSEPPAKRARLKYSPVTGNQFRLKLRKLQEPILSEVKLEVDIAEEMPQPWVSEDCIQSPLLNFANPDQLSSTQTERMSECQPEVSSANEVVVKLEEPVEYYNTDSEEQNLDTNREMAWTVTVNGEASSEEYQVASQTRVCKEEPVASDSDSEMLVGVTSEGGLGSERIQTGSVPPLVVNEARCTETAKEKGIKQIGRVPKEHLQSKDVSGEERRCNRKILFSQASSTAFSDISSTDDESANYSSQQEVTPNAGRTNACSIKSKIARAIQIRRESNKAPVKLNTSFNASMKDATTQLNSDISSDELDSEQTLATIPANKQTQMPELQPSQKKINKWNFFNIQINKETRQILYPCPECSASFTHPKNLAMHLRKHNPYACEKCDITFKERTDFMAHIETHKQILFSMYRFNKVLTQKSSVRDLKKNHAEEKQFTCSDCKVVFAESSLYNAHMQKHKVQTHYVCSKCNAVFPEAGLLKEHMWTHADLRLHKCSDCRAAFKRKNALRAHMRQHKI